MEFVSICLGVQRKAASANSVIYQRLLHHLVKNLCWRGNFIEEFAVDLTAVGLDVATHTMFSMFNPFGGSAEPKEDASAAKQPEVAENTATVKREVKKPTEV